MVGHHHEDRVLRHLLPQAPDEVVRPAVDLLDRVAVLRSERLVVHRVLRIDEPPHHVRDAVGGLDRRHEQVPVVRLEPLEDDLLAVVHRAVGVVEELRLVEPALVERLVARLGPAERAVEPDLLRELLREGGRVGDRDRRVARVHVDGRAVDPQLAPRLEHAELRDAVDAHERVDLERERHPAAPLAGLQVELLALDLDVGRARALGPAHGHRQVDVLAGRERVEPRLLLLGEGTLLLLLAQLRLFLLQDRALGPAQRRLGDAAVEQQPLQEAAELGVALLVRAEVGRPVIEGAERAAQVGQRQARPASGRGAAPRAGT